MHQTGDLNTITNPEKIVQFVKESINGELPYFWETDKETKRRFSEKIVGEDFDKRVLSSKKDAVVFIAHPIKEKNRHMAPLWERLARDLKGSDITIGRMNGINEPSSYRVPEKLPQIVYFRKEEG